MSDKEVIISLLERAERRTHANRKAASIAAGLALALLAPVAFKLIDLWKPFRGTTVLVFFMVWAVATLALLFSVRREREDLASVAEDLDRKTAVKDELRTAYWFIRHPLKSPWVDEQLHQTAQRASRIQLENIYPRPIPKTSYVAGGLLILLIGLNILPVKSNNNWLQLQAAPNLALTESQKALLANARNLLKQSRAAGKADGLEFESMLDENNPALSLDSLMKNIEQLKQELDSEKQQSEKIVMGLKQMASALQTSPRYKQTAEAMNQNALEQAAEDVRRAAEQMAAGTNQENQQAGQALDKAAEETVSQLNELAQDMKKAAQATKQGNAKDAQAAHEKMAQDFEQIAQKLDRNGFMAKASSQLDQLMQSLQGQPPQDGAEAGQSAAGAGEEQQQDTVGLPTNPDDPGDASGDEGGTAGKDPGGTGQMPSNRSGPRESAPFQGAATSLDVQLEKETLNGEFNAALAKQTQDKNSDQDAIEQASVQSRSQLDYRKVPSTLTAAQKDLLNQDRIPWENRELVKQYFQAIRPQPKQ